VKRRAAYTPVNFTAGIGKKDTVLFQADKARGPHHPDRNPFYPETRNAVMLSCRLSFMKECRGRNRLSAPSEKSQDPTTWLGPRKEIDDQILERTQVLKHARTSPRFIVQIMANETAAGEEQTHSDEQEESEDVESDGFRCHELPRRVREFRVNDARRAAAVRRRDPG
jgi:hypothetical protein